MQGYYIKIIKMGTIATDRYDKDEDGVHNFHKIENTAFTKDGLNTEPSRFNYFPTPREALLAFSELLTRHTDYDYVDIVMAYNSGEYYII